MTIRIGILGLGFMGKCHFETWGSIPGAHVAAICEVDARRRGGDWSGIAGNIGKAGGKTDLRGIRTYARVEEMLADPQLDVIDITLPTYLHLPAALAALKAGKHVVCEKPLAMDGATAKRLQAAAVRARGRLFVAHCIRFWPAYAAAREIVHAGRYGKVRTAAFRRSSTLPTWSWQNWLQDPAKSGLCALDLHVHDADFILHCFGRPRAVKSQGGGLSCGRLDHIHTSYEYASGTLITAEGAWEYAPGFPFSMTFAIALEKASLHLGQDGKLMLYPAKGQSREIKVSAASGYEMELRHFQDCIRRDRDSEVVSVASAVDSVRLIEAEVKSARTGKTVRFS